MKRKSVFWPVYFGLVGLFLLALAGGLLFMDKWTAEYEAAQPESIIKTQVITGLAAGEVPNLSVSPYETEAEVSRALAEAVQGKTLTVVKASAQDADYDATYAVKAGDTRLVKVYLMKNTEPEPLGSIGYTVAKVVPDSGLGNEVTVTMPKSAVVSVNGIALTESDCTDLELPVISGTNLPELTMGRCKAVLKNLIGSSLAIEAVDFEGNKLTVTQDGNHYTVLQNIPEKTQNEIAEFALEATRAYATFLQDDMEKESIISYFDPSSALYKKVRAAHSMRDTNHSGHKFEEESVNEFYQYADTVYACRVKFKQLIYKSSQTYSDVFDKTVFVRKRGGRYYVMDVRNTDA